MMEQELEELPISLLNSTVTADGVALFTLTEQRPQLFLFLRHAGCTFCREALADIANRRAAIEARGVGIVLVHMMTEKRGHAFLEKYGLGDIPHVSDQERELYKAFQLRQGGIKELLSPKVWIRGVESAFIEGHGVGPSEGGDPFQMPGAFLVKGNHILRAYRHETAADRPDYEELTTCQIA